MQRPTVGIDMTHKAFNLRDKNMLSCLLAVFLLLSSLFMGVLATTDNMITVGAGLGILVGGFLLAAPRLVVWIMIGLGLTAGVLVSLAGPAYAKLPWVLSTISFILWPLALFHLLQHKRVPLFVWLSLGFVLLSAVTSLFDGHSLDEFVAGFKRYFQAYGLLFGLAVLAFNADDIRRWQKLVLVIALLQLPFSLYEFFVLVPLRGGLINGSSALDVVAGTFGANLSGGSPNAEMAAFLLIVLAFLSMRWRVGLLRNSQYYFYSLICLIPLGLGETKIVVLLLPLLVCVLLRRDFFREPSRYLPYILGFFALTFLFAYIYVDVMMQSTFSDVLVNTLHYNFDSTGYGDAYLNRSTVLGFWWQQHSWDDPLSLLFGHGLGSSYWSPNNLLAGHIGMRYARYGIDLTAISSMLWDIGLVGVLLHILIIFSAWRTANQLVLKSQNSATRADALSIQAALSIIFIFMFYNNSAVNIFPYQILIAIFLGYLAYLYRTENDPVDDAKPYRR